MEVFLAQLHRFSGSQIYTLNSRNSDAKRLLECGKTWFKMIKR